jgi:hypothetical protein
MLTVYVSGVCHDPSEKAVWRVQLDNAIADAMERLVNTPQEMQRFERCVR